MFKCNALNTTVYCTSAYCTVVMCGAVIQALGPIPAACHQNLDVSTLVTSDLCAKDGQQPDLTLCLKRAGPHLKAALSQNTLQEKSQVKEMRLKTICSPKKIVSIRNQWEPNHKVLLMVLSITSLFNWFRSFSTCFKPLTSDKLISHSSVLERLKSEPKWQL